MRGMFVMAALVWSVGVSHADTVTTKVPDVVSVSYFKCVKADGSIEFASSPAPAGGAERYAISRGRSSPLTRGALAWMAIESLEWTIKALLS